MYIFYNTHSQKPQINRNFIILMKEIQQKNLLPFFDKEH